MSEPKPLPELDVPHWAVHYCAAVRTAAGLQGEITDRQIYGTYSEVCGRQKADIPLIILTMLVLLRIQRHLKGLS